jgi:asparagine synthase (glutamine-hydrolysing)
MCGISGIFNLNGEPVSPDVLQKMTEVIAHRGPDSDGYYVDKLIGLGHKRLAILDLTPSGHQPMHDDSEDFWIVYNGELYNHEDIRVDLEKAGYQFFSRSDTETVLLAYKEWGAACLERFNGMFAFAIWDKKARELFLARDRFGVKPVYYYFDRERFIFASEIKAILEHPDIPRSVCFPALNEYFTFQNVLTDKTLFEGIKILPAGYHLTITFGKDSGPVKKQFWDFDFSKTRSISYDDAIAELNFLFSQAVSRQLMSDVPIASYLSGGMDSGSIVAVARQHLGRLMTFTGGFDLSSASGMELGFDERKNAELLSNFLKTEQYEMVMHAGDMEHIMPELIWHLEDLSGAGGDELFAGYPWRYFRGMGNNGKNYYRNYYDFWQRLVPDDEKPQLFNDEIYSHLIDHSTFDVFRNVLNPGHQPLKTKKDFINASLYFELKTFLHGLLVVEDKISMAHSLETRVPFLDNDLVDFACQLPIEYKLNNIEKAAHAMDENEPGKRIQYELRSQDGKRILREAMQQFIPEQVTGRVKQGFSAPDASWFRGESIDYVNNLLRGKETRIYDYLKKDYVTQRLNEHTSGQYNHRLFIWSLLSFEWWLRHFI